MMRIRTAEGYHLAQSNKIDRSIILFILAKDDLEAYAIAIVSYWRMQFDMGEGLVNFSWI